MATMAIRKALSRTNVFRCTQIGCTKPNPNKTLTVFLNQQCYTFSNSIERFFMKTWFFTAAFTIAVSANASIQFKTNSEIPADVQAEIEKTLHVKCPKDLQQPNLIDESETVTFVDRVDNGLTDTYFYSNFRVFVKELDSNHSRIEQIKTITVYTEANNGTSVQTEVVDDCH